MNNIHLFTSNLNTHIETHLTPCKICGSTPALHDSFNYMDGKEYIHLYCKNGHFKFSEVLGSFFEYRGCYVRKDGESIRNGEFNRILDAFKVVERKWEWEMMDTTNISAEEYFNFWKI